MRVTIKSEHRANGHFIVEKWASGRTIDHGPMDVDKLEDYARTLQAAIIEQHSEQSEILGALVRTEEQRAFFHAQKVEPWQPKKR
jgi:hypothetical protein